MWTMRSWWSARIRTPVSAKKDDLAALWVYKFKSQSQLYLLGYTLDEGVRLVYLEAIGPHENFYRDLKP